MTTQTDTKISASLLLEIIEKQRQYFEKCLEDSTHETRIYYHRGYIDGLEGASEIVKGMMEAKEGE